MCMYVCVCCDSSCSSFQHFTFSNILPPNSPVCDLKSGSLSAKNWLKGLWYIFCFSSLPSTFHHAWGYDDYFGLPYLESLQMMELWVFWTFQSWPSRNPPAELVVKKEMSSWMVLFGGPRHFDCGPVGLSGGFLRSHYSTLQETNIAPENRPLEKEIPIGNQHFGGIC